jgi:hypothetical protein
MDANTTALEVASIGLFGVLLGSVISTAANIILAARRERVEAGRDERSRAIEFKMAARLISEELSMAAARVGDSVERKRWSPSKFTNDAWQKYKNIIAPQLTDNEWLEVSIAFSRIDTLLMADAHGEITDSTLEHLAPVLRDIECGWRILRTRALDVQPTTPAPKKLTGTAA